MSRSIADLMRNNPFGGPLTPVNCESPTGLKVNPTRTIAAAAASSSGGGKDDPAPGSYSPSSLTSDHAPVILFVHRL